MSIASKLVLLAEDVVAINEIKEDIRLAIVAKGESVGVEEPLSTYPTHVAAIQSGGGSNSDGFLVRFIDYDGTLLKEEYVAHGGSATPPPTPSGDSILTPLGWHGTYQNVVRDEVVGAKYWFGGGSDLKSYLFLRLDSVTGLTVNVRLYITSGAATINWGDNTSSATSGTGDKITSHTYPSVGDYTISIDGLQVNGNELGARGPSTYSVVDIPRALVKAYVGWPTVLGRYAFRNCTCMRAVCLSFIGSTKGSGNLGGFYGCLSLKALIVPSTYKIYNPYDPPFGNSSIRYFIMPEGGNDAYSLSTYSFQNCNALETISLYPCALSGTYTFKDAQGLKKAYLSDIPAASNKQLASCFQGCKNLEEVVLPSNVTEIASECFYNCNSLKRLDFPSSVTTFKSIIIDYCWSLKVVIVRSTTPPTISGTNPLASIANTSSDLKFYVPDASVDAYKGATGWLTVADRILPISQVPA